MKLKSVINGGILLGIFINAVACNSCESKSRKPEKIEGTITLKQANELEERYKSTRHRIINNALGFDSLGIEDSREIWFSLDRIKKYITYVEKEADKKGYEELGLRFYLGVYPDTKDNKGFTTLFAVPTTTSIKKDPKAGYFMQPPAHEISENMDNVEALNLGGAGHPPKELAAQ
ncbi:hypothetical protein [Aquimarina agarilytica]|uniref:hypothetical protein n=1 Tax=Aquimarina agarilytica TaxID=1087449 RepID=UPI0002893F59|nr:hypothetical protein [Aquimarina agarilytica]